MYRVILLLILLLSGSAIADNVEMDGAYFASTLNDLEKELVSTLETKKINQDSIIEYAKKRKKSASRVEKKYFSFLIDLKKTNLKLLNIEDSYNKSLKEKISYFQKQAPPFNADFETVETSWLKVSNENFEKLLQTKLNVSLPSIPKGKKLRGKLNELQRELVEQNLVETKKIKKRVLFNLSETRDKEIKILNDLLLKVNEMRSSLFLKQTIGEKYSSILSFDGVEKLKQEIYLSPYRLVSFLYKQYFRFRELVSKGREGYLKISMIVLKYLFLFSLLWGAQGFVVWAEKKSSLNLRRLVLRFSTNSFLKKFYNFWNKIKGAIPDLVWLVFVSLCSNLDYFSSIEFLFHLIKIVVIARLIKTFVTLFLSSVSMITNSNFYSFKKKADETSNSFKNIYLSYALITFVVEATIGKVYIYLIVKSLILIYCTYRIMKTSVDWEDEFQHFVEASFSGVVVEKFSKMIAMFPKSIRSIILFFAIVLMSVLNAFIRLTEDFTFSKKISANIFKKQIESVEADESVSGSVPEEYKTNFSFHSIDSDEFYVENDKRIEQSIELEIFEWRSERSEEHSLVLFGDKGSGKTSLMKHVKSKLDNIGELDEKVETVYLKLPSKVLTKEALQSFILKSLEIDLEGKNFDFPAIDKKLESKKVIFLDECQNVFLSQTGGFKGYYHLTELLNMPTNNIFWVLSFNKSSWLYLNSAFGRTQFFRNVFEIKAWSDERIKELIMKRHDRSGFNLSYDLLISATKSQDEIDKYSSVESKFFKLLWELSRGNPRTALALWISALSVKSSNTFNVNIPKDIETVELSHATDNVLFVLAHILKHENLSLAEVISTSTLQKGVVRNSIKIALEQKYLHRDDRSRYMIDIISQGAIIKLLKAKNFLYGS